jgi:ribonuclease P protein subunit POP4
MPDNRNIVMHELIGLEVEVVSSADPDQMGIRGVVIDETKHTLSVETAEGIKRLVKKVSTFRFVSEGKGLIVEGKEIDFRPHERLEKSLKFYKKRKL